MASSVRLRRWQRDALDALRASTDPDFLTVATPGAGKTTFALTAARIALAEQPGARLVVVAPTRHLKTQWADAAERLALRLEPDWATRRRPPADVHGVVVTYQQVAADPARMAKVAKGAVAVFDEIHHAGDERAWGDGLREAFEGAARRLSLSGTPFRSDTRAIPFVRYDTGVAKPDVEYGYDAALADGGVVRPVFFPRFNGHMEWVAPDGSVAEATFDDALDRTAASQRLRTALSTEGDWLPTVLGQAHHHLLGLRATHPDAGGLVIATDQEHAWAIADLLRSRFRARAIVATSDDPSASDRIAAFAASDEPWIVAVRMVSEGVDIPRLRIGVWATTTATELFFRQAVGRLVRWTPGLGRQRSFFFLPDDPRLRTFAERMAESRRHALHRDSAADDPEQAEPEPTERPDEPDAEQLSLFAPLSARTLDDSVAELSVFAQDHPDDPDRELVDVDDPELLLPLAPPPPLPDSAGPSPRQRRIELREENSHVAGVISDLTGESHARVNGELNRTAGITSVAEATMAQLEKRLEHARRWRDAERSRTRSRAQLR
ncbi:MAG: DEAD/DEAH box helicase family protein [Actinomycetota bacterium]